MKQTAENDITKIMRNTGKIVDIIYLFDLDHSFRCPSKPYSQPTSFLSLLY